MRVRHVIAAMLVTGCGGRAAAPVAHPQPVSRPAPPPAPAVPAVPAVLIDGQIVEDPPAVELPAIPDFELPRTAPGVHGVKELAIHGRAMFGEHVQVDGYVTWIYDCVAERKAATGKSAAEVERSIEQDPTQCRRPVFHLSSTPDAHDEWGFDVVEVPRRPNRLERKRLSAAELAEWPAVPTLAVGDHVLVVGTWSDHSPHGERNSDGMLIYDGLVPVEDDR